MLKLIVNFISFAYAQGMNMLYLNVQITHFIAYCVTGKAVKF